MKRSPPLGKGWTVLDREGTGWAMRSDTGLTVIASYGLGWDHVSVSRKDRTPSWEDMNQVKELLFDPEECVVQYHPPRSRYRNFHPYCLHLWRPQAERMPMPPIEMV